MNNSYTAAVPHLEIYVHFVWATWDRQDWITPDWESILYHEIHNQITNLNCGLIAVGGVENHIHLLLDLPATVEINNIVKQVKGSSSFFVNRNSLFDVHFQWQHEYAALAVSRWDVTKIKNYIQNQKEHHAKGTTKLSLELPPLSQLRESKRAFK